MARTPGIISVRIHRLCVRKLGRSQGSGLKKNRTLLSVTVLFFARFLTPERYSQEVDISIGWVAAGLNIDVV